MQKLYYWRVMVLFLWWVPFFLSAQTTKGVVESSDHVVTAAPMGEAYALIVGVSNYPYVKPLNFAEEDALLFFEFLRSNAGGNIPENHIKLLLNEQATHANVTAGLAWLNNSVGAQPKAGDRVYIYLSGHGDAYDASEAYYLCYDSNPAGDKNNYQLGGALDIGKMKKRVAAMVSKGVEVILIVDACRSGDVPGVRSGIGNPYQSVIEEPAGEVLLLSAGPNQFALEDRRWGGGHGGFTWYLMKGLSGEADVDGDGNVSLFEIESYTKMKVIGDTKQMGAAQTPYVCCNNKFDCVLSKKDEWFSKRVREEESGNTKVGLTALAARDALEKAMFEKEELKQKYFALKKACKEQRYLGNNSAWSIWEDCKGEYTPQEIEPLRMYLMGALAAEGQKAINEEMNVSFGYSPGYDYYHSRREWVEHAMRMMISPDEIVGIASLRDFIDALELSNSVSNVTPFLDSIIYICNDKMVKSKTIAPFEKADSLFKKLEKEYAKSAVYHFLLQSHEANWDLFLPGTKNTHRRKEILKAMELAPSWAKPIRAAMLMNLLSIEELSEIMENRIKEDPNNFENYYLSYCQTFLTLPINKKKALDQLQKAFDLHPNAALVEKLLLERFPKYIFNAYVSINSRFDNFYAPTDKDWVVLKDIMDKYYQSDLHTADCLWDSTFEIRSVMALVIGMATRLNHEKEAIEWIKKENALCPSADGWMIQSVLEKYVMNDLPASQISDQRALEFEVNDQAIVEMMGVKRDHLPSGRKNEIIYHFRKTVVMLSFFRDDWMERELNEIKNISTDNEEVKKMVFMLRVILRNHFDLDKTNFEKWNQQVEEVRHVNRPDWALTLLNQAKLYDVLDSMIIFEKDPALMDYLGINNRMDAYIHLLSVAPKTSSDSLEMAAQRIFEEVNGNKLIFGSYLAFSKRNQRFESTQFFDQNFKQPKDQMERLLLYQIYDLWGDNKKASEVFLSFDWQNGQTIVQPLILLTLLNEAQQSLDLVLMEEMMDTMIPYAFNAKDQDYSDSISAIQDFFFLNTKNTDALRKSPEYQRLLKKYVVMDN